MNTNKDSASVVDPMAIKKGEGGGVVRNISEFKEIPKPIFLT